MDRLRAPEEVRGNAEHYLGVIALQSGRFEDAVRLIDKAVQLRPRNHDALINLGNAQQAVGRYEAALDAYGRALALMPESAPLLANLGNALALFFHDGAFSGSLIPAFSRFLWPSNLFWKHALIL